MNFNWIEDRAQLPETIIIPFVAGDALAGQLAQACGQYSAARKGPERDFDASANSVLLLYPSEERTLILLGLGKEPGFAEMLVAFRTLSFKHGKQLAPDTGIDISPVAGAVDTDILIEAACNGLLLGTYRIGRFKQKKDKEPHPLAGAQALVKVYSGEEGKEGYPKAAARGLALASTQMGIFDLVNAPGNKKRPEALAAWALASGKEHGYQVEVLDKDAIREAGLHALLAVNRGSEDDPAFIIMDYVPKEKPAGHMPVVGLVGKGVTFDTGGLSIKPSQNMHLMKSDMGGAAAVFGALEAAARLQLPLRLLGIVPVTDNCVDAKAVKPGDIIDSYSGKTIEVIDTDAEGRLILADGLAYMRKNYKPDIMIDLATLTGSAVRALGYHAAALFSDNDKLAGLLLEAGERSGERSWRMPMWEVYGEELKADMADLRNLGKRPIAGAIFAAKFLEAFTDEHPAWAHLDIAGVAFQQSAFAKEHSATGYGVRLLIDFLRHFPSQGL